MTSPPSTPYAPGVVTIVMGSGSSGTGGSGAGGVGLSGVLGMQEQSNAAASTDTDMSLFTVIFS